MLRYTLTDKDRTDEVGGNYGKLTIADGETGKVKIESPREFSVVYGLVGPSSTEYTVSVLCNITGDPNNIIMDTVLSEDVASTTATLWKYEPHIYTTFRNNFELDIENTSGAEVDFWFQIHAYEGPEAPFRKF